MIVQDISVGRKINRSKEELIAGEDKRQQLMDEDSQMVTGIFKNLDAPGGELTLSYKKYKEDPIRQYTFQDGAKETIPLGLAKHLNQGTAYANREYAKDPQGVPLLTTIIKSRTQRYQFLSTDYM